MAPPVAIKVAIWPRCFPAPTGFACTGSWGTMEEASHLTAPAPAPPYVLMPGVYPGTPASGSRGDGPRVPLDAAAESVPAADEEVLRVSEALDELAEVDQRQVKIVEMRYFGRFSSLTVHHYRKNSLAPPRESSAIRAGRLQNAGTSITAPVRFPAPGTWPVRVTHSLVPSGELAMPFNRRFPSGRPSDRRTLRRATTEPSWRM